ncbi:hypothetical protein CcaverHIS641_0411550 [Cutaneotrichosporon cavernicola]|nr:hypothetical protein CcaverHIS641_0411550 [Cutaneotrichosporon cavernicola]
MSSPEPSSPSVEPSQPTSQEPTSEPPTSNPPEPTTTSPEPSQPPTSNPPTSEPPPSSNPPDPPSTSNPPPPSSDPTSSPPHAPNPSSTVAPPPASSNRPTVLPSLILPGGTTQLTSGVLITTTDANGNTITTAPSVLTTGILKTDASGRVYTVTAIVHNTASINGSSSRGGGSDFFQNTGAVAGVFVVVGLVVAAGIGAFTFFTLRRRRRQRLDRDVAAAAVAAAAAQQPRFDDDDDHSPAMTQYGAYYASNTSHDFENSTPQSTRGYDYEAAGGYDPYAANLVDVSNLPGDTNYHNAGTTYPPNGQYYVDPNGNGAPDFSRGGADYHHSYGDPQYDVAHVYAGHDETLPTVPEHQEDQYRMSYYNYPDDAAYNYNEFDEAPPAASLERQQSVGSVNSGAVHRDLTVTNV